MSAQQCCSGQPGRPWSKPIELPAGPDAKQRRTTSQKAGAASACPERRQGSTAGQALNQANETRPSSSQRATSASEYRSPKARATSIFFFFSPVTPLPCFCTTYHDKRPCPTTEPYLHSNDLTLQLPGLCCCSPFSSLSLLPLPRRSPRLRPASDLLASRTPRPTIPLVLRSRFSFPQ